MQHTELIERPARKVPAAMAQRLIVALDVPTVAAARQIVAELDGIASFFKIGMWLLFQRETDALIDDLIAAGKQVFLDYKMYDIGETVKQGVRSAAGRGISFVTVHGDDAIMRAAVQGRGDSDLKLLAITVLTSLNDAALHDMGYRLGVADLIALRIRRAIACGCDGVIASASDDPDRLREAAGADSLLIATPGVRLAGDATNDHQRSADPATAIRKGADYLVVGRPIVDAPDRAARARAVIAAMEEGRPGLCPGPVTRRRASHDGA
jgi:orotidine-5'-phosphate decarboxylase